MLPIEMLNLSEAAKIAVVQKVMETAKKSPSDPDYCPHHFGYLGQRSKGEEISGVCMTCLKLLDCMISKPKTSEVLPPLVAPIKREASTLRVKREIGIAKEANVSVDHSKETAREELKTTFKPEIKTKPPSKEPSENQFKVKDLDMLYASWSETVCIDRQSMSGWGKETKEVEIETGKGKRARCKVYPIAGSERGVIHVPDKVQVYLEIGRGELVAVRPLTK